MAGRHRNGCRIHTGMTGAWFRFAVLLFVVVPLVGTVGPRKLVRLMASADRTCDVAKAEGLDGDGGAEWVLPVSVDLPETGACGVAASRAGTLVTAGHVVAEGFARAPPAS